MTSGLDRRPPPRSRRELELTVTRRGQELLDRYDDLRPAEPRLLLQRLPGERRSGALTVLAEFAASPAVTS